MVVTAWQRLGSLQVGFPASYRASLSFRTSLGDEAPNLGGWREDYTDANGTYDGNVVANAVSPGFEMVDQKNAFDPRNPPIFATGWFQKDIDFGSFNTTMNAQGSSRDAYVTRATKGYPNPTDWLTNWVFRFRGSGNAEGLCVAAGLFTETPGSEMDMFVLDTPEEPGVIRKVQPNPIGKTYAGVGGYFTGEIICGNGTVDLVTADAGANGEDAFVAVIYADQTIGNTAGGRGDGDILGRDIIAFLHLGRSGADRVRGIAIDPVDGAVVVTGQFTGTDLQFDPQGDNGAATKKTSIGGTDIFVARYLLTDQAWPKLPEQPTRMASLELDWLYTTGTSGNDSGSCVAIDGFGHVYAAGWKNGAGNKRDIWIAKINETPDGANGLTPNIVTSPEWSYTYTDPPGDVGDDAALAISLDGLDRVLVSGQFGRERAAGGSAQNHTLDFNPDPNVTDYRTTAGGLDAFVTRLKPTGGYQWTSTFGGTSPSGGYNEVGTGVAVDPIETTRVAHCGWFAHPDAPALNYTLDCDPGNGLSILAATGSADGFVSSLLPTMPSSIKTQTTLVLDNSGSVEFPKDYSALMGTLDDVLKQAVNVPQDGTAALNAVRFGDLLYKGAGGELGLNDYGVRKIMPWTVFTAETAPLFARKIGSIPQAPTQTTTEIYYGIQGARRSLINDRLVSCYRSLLVIADDCNKESANDADQSMAKARDSVLNIVNPDQEPDVDQINGIAVVTNEPFVPSPTQAYFRNYVVGSDASSGLSPPNQWLGFALETVDADDQFEDAVFPVILAKILKKSTRCPGDFDRNGHVDSDDMNHPTTGFLHFYNLSDPSAGWNFDGSVTSVDLVLFTLAYNLGCCQ